VTRDVRDRIPPREQAFVKWCERADYTADDRDAPHTEAFFGGYDAGYRAALEDAVKMSPGERTDA
jgi:hypothetical protein